MTLIRYTKLVLLFALVTGCAPAARWPPQPAATPKVESPGDARGNGLSMNDYAFVYEDLALTRRGNTDPWGICATGGEMDLPFDLFAIEEASNLGYVQASFEVLTVDSKSTHIRLNAAKGDRVLMIQPHGAPGTPEGRSRLELLIPGTKVRCGDRELQLRRAGWYEAGKLVHAFTTADK